MSLFPDLPSRFLKLRDGDVDLGLQGTQVDGRPIPPKHFGFVRVAPRVPLPQLIRFLGGQRQCAGRPVMEPLTNAAIKQAMQRQDKTTP